MPETRFPNRHPFTMGHADKVEADLALGLYATELGAIARRLEAVGEQSAADRLKALERTINEPDEEIGLRIRIRKGHPPEITNLEVKMIRAALPLLVKRLTAVAGSEAGLGEEERAEELRERASIVEERTLALFDEQTQVALEAPAPLSPAEEAEAAEAEAEAVQKLERLTLS